MDLIVSQCNDTADCYNAEFKGKGFNLFKRTAKFQFNKNSIMVSVCMCVFKYS